MSRSNVTPAHPVAIELDGSWLGKCMTGGLGFQAKIFLSANSDHFAAYGASKTSLSNDSVTLTI